MPDFRIVETTVSDKADQLKPLLCAHRDELPTHARLAEVAPNWHAYRLLEQNASLLALLAYAGDELAGYSVGFVGQHLHSSGLRYLHHDALYVKPEYRPGGLGVAIMRETEKRAREKGACLVMWHAKPGSALEKILPRLGYGVEETLYSKEL